MRVAPLGLVRQWTLEQSFDYAAEAAALTHGHPSGYLSAGACAAILRLLLDGRDLREAIEKTMALLGSKPTHAEVTTAIDLAIRKKRSNQLPAVSDLGEGWIAEEALSIAVYSALNADSFVEALTIAANHSGDSDSTASIAGQLHGARKGLSDLPNSWIRRIDVLIPLLRLTGELIASQRSYQ